MRMPLFKSVRWRVILCTIACVAFVGIASNLYIYHYLSNIITEKVYSIDRLNRQSIAHQLDTQLASATTLVVQCANLPAVLDTVSHGRPNSNREMRPMLEGQQIMSGIISASMVSPYLNKMMLYSEDGLYFQSQRQSHWGSLQDPMILMSQPFYSELFQKGLLGGRLSLTSHSISPYQSGQCLASIQPVTTGPASTAEAWVYAEFSSDMITDILNNYLPSGFYFVAADHQVLLPDAIDTSPLPDQPMHELQSGDTFLLHDDTWRVVSEPLASFSGLRLISCINESALLLDSRRIFHTVLVVLVGSLSAGLLITILMSNILTKPILRLTDRIRRISNNDFDFDPDIEKGNDEIASIGRVVNEMTLSVRHLLAETHSQAEQKRKIELAMLQSQVNPHFLYNTLDAIHWMAVIQKNPGIQQMTRSLSNLLKHMAKGYNHKIPLTEEVSLLSDYIEIMSIRYMDTFELINEIRPEFYQYKIIKLTLQPLVENAIFHGIEPTGRFGTIRLYAEEDENDLLISVEDDGQGMDEEAIHRALTTQTKTSHGSMNGIGVCNVNERLHLVYGPKYGLTIRSQPGKFTCMTVRIPKEEEN